MIDSVQSYLTLVGLLTDIVGVIIVSKYWLDGVGGGLQKLLQVQTNMNLRWASDARKAINQLATARASGASWWKLFSQEIGLAGRRMNARIYNERVKFDRRQNGLDDLSVLTADDYWNDAAIKAHSAQMQEYYADLIARGAPDSVFPKWGFRLIIGGFVLQFFGALPIG